MKPEDAEEYTQALGQVVAGGWRQIALGQRLGVPQALKLSVDEWVKQRLGGYVKLSMAERREAVAELRAEGKSKRDVAAVLGVDEKTVRNDLSDAEYSAESTDVSEGGDVDDAENSAPLDVMAGLAVTNAWAAASARPHVSNNSGENEWYTPAALIEAAKATMGVIDLDPASSPIANRTVGAKQFYTAEDDGLLQRWRGSVWMNPPYAQPLITQFAEAVSDKFDAKEIKRACVLVNNATETGWFQRMLMSASAVCFLKGRVQFLDPSGAASGAPLQGQAVLYLGEAPSRFAQSFADLGPVLVKRG